MSTEPPDDRFITLLLANQSRVYRFLFTLVPRREDVEDLFQQTCLTLWQERAKFDPEKGEFAGWACAIALAALGLVPAKGLKLRGDLGATFGDPAGRDTILRSHWNNQATGLVADEVYELMLEPKNWGVILFE